MQFLTIFGQLRVIFNFPFCFLFKERVIFKNCHFELKITLLRVKNEGFCQIIFRPILSSIIAVLVSEN